MDKPETKNVGADGSMRGLLMFMLSSYLEWATVLMLAGIFKWIQAEPLAILCITLLGGTVQVIVTFYVMMKMFEVK